MNKLILSFFLFALILLSSCQAIAGIFKAGVWVGVFIVIAILALVIYLFSRSKK
ncbi:MAG: phosphatidate cytidylyltransferase [Niastella sp. SCN 39-18]|nr:phosphatidate cytidylyltransferase [Sphingobacteriales bacterium]ODT52553.1 MAG: phosphatidate cytidylyltransferase [Niastella sp. SCN 39-18]OJW11693.1 MAG: phosphatidate cytidylyltransferase [Sphingobacteriales bacterium 39-19]